MGIVPPALPKTEQFPEIECCDFAAKEEFISHFSFGSHSIRMIDVSQNVKGVRPRWLKISHILNIPINSICKDNPYDPGETLPQLPSDKEQLMINLQKKAYFSDRTLKLVEIFDYTELPNVDKLIADFFVLNDVARSDLFEYIQIMKRSHTDPKRQKILDQM